MGSLISWSMFPGRFSLGVANSHCRQCQKEGIWAWDCLENEPVLVVPVVLAFLGDNPMQSEFACHIGLKGKFFCRVCWAKGSDALVDAATTPHPERDPDAGSDAGSHAGSDIADELEGGVAEDQGADDGSNPSAVPKKMKGRRGKALETMSGMINRCKAFIKVSYINYEFCSSTEVLIFT